MLLNTFVENGHSPEMHFDVAQETSELEPQERETAEVDVRFSE